jgi:hypothetical protein
LPADKQLRALRAVTDALPIAAYITTEKGQGLIGALTDPDPRVVARAEQQLKLITKKGKGLIGALRDPDPRVVARAEQQLKLFAAQQS